MKTEQEVLLHLAQQLEREERGGCRAECPSVPDDGGRWGGREEHGGGNGDEDKVVMVVMRIAKVYLTGLKAPTN